MNTKIVGLIAAIILAGGAVFFFVSGDEDTNTASTDSSEQESNTNTSDGSNNLLDIDTAALTGAYRLEISSTGGEDSLSGTFDVDGNGNVSTLITTNGQKSAYIYLDGVTYVQNPQDQSWISYPSGSAAAPSFNVDDLALSDDDINEISSDTTIEELGEQPCVTGTCRVYRDVDAEENQTAVVKIDVATKRLVEVVVTDNTTNEVTTIVYSYPNDISIKAPEGAVEFNIPDTTQ